MFSPMKSARIRGLAWMFFAATLVLPGSGASAHAEWPAQRWLYLQINLQVPENVTQADALLKRAAKAGYNGVVLADSGVVADRTKRDDQRDGDHRGILLRLSRHLVPHPL